MARWLLLASLLIAGVGCSGPARQVREDPPPSPTGGDPVARPEEGVSPEKFDEIDRFFHRKVNSLQFTCYNREVDKTGQKYEGNVSFSLMILPGGKASKVAITNSTLKSPGIEQCVLDEMKEWEWPEVPVAAPYNGSINFKPAW